MTNRALAASRLAAASVSSAAMSVTASLAPSLSPMDLARKYSVQAAAIAGETPTGAGGGSKQSFPGYPTDGRGRVLRLSSQS